MLECRQIWCGIRVTVLIRHMGRQFRVFRSNIASWYIASFVNLTILQRARHNHLPKTNVFYLKPKLYISILLICYSLFYCNRYLRSFFLSNPRCLLTHCRIEFRKAHRKIDAAKRGTPIEFNFVRNILLLKLDIDLTERKIAASDSRSRKPSRNAA